jgi:hypothetical protein
LHCHWQRIAKLQTTEDVANSITVVRSVPDFGDGMCRMVSPGAVFLWDDSNFVGVSRKKIWMKRISTRQDADKESG